MGLVKGNGFKVAVLIVSLLGVAGTLPTFAQQSRAVRYACLPCGQGCDTLRFSKEGICSQCEMPLVEESLVSAGTIEPHEICQYVKDHPGVVLMDIRSSEYLAIDRSSGLMIGSLKGDIKFPFSDFFTRRADLNSMKGKTLILYCSTGTDAPLAAYYLKKWGFPNVYFVKDGIYKLTDPACKYY
ncbi:MAG: rhodanese-like domain-containing protein [Cyclobacteriaceae bacterium]|nr:rhodanese-like domain-containing protein [Cyclobacteriaceae bacterium]